MVGISPHSSIHALVCTYIPLGETDVGPPTPTEHCRNSAGGALGRFLTRQILYMRRVGQGAVARPLARKIDHIKPWEEGSVREIHCKDPSPIFRLFIIKFLPEAVAVEGRGRRVLNCLSAAAGFEQLRPLNVVSMPASPG